MLNIVDQIWLETVKQLRLNLLTVQKCYFVVCDLCNDTKRILVEKKRGKKGKQGKLALFQPVGGAY